MKIIICVPAGGGVCRIETAATIFGMADHKSEHKLAFCHAQGCDIPYNRNRMVDVALRMGADAIFWLDADVTGPNDAIDRLAAHNMAIVGASYRRREPGNERMMGERTGEYKRSHGQGLIGMNMLPGGFALVRREVYERIEPPWYSEGYVKYPMFATDDYWFCQKAKAAGYDIWCDGDVTNEVTHFALMPLVGSFYDIKAAPQEDDCAK